MNVVINLIFLCVSSPRINREALFIGTCTFTNNPRTNQCTFTLIAINVQQFRMFAVPLLPGEEMLQIKTVKDFG